MKKFFESNPFFFTTGGAAPDLPDDTINNFAHAVSLGADVIQTNVFITSDKKLVLASDAVLRQTAMMRAGIDRCSADDIRAAYRKAAGTGHTKNGRDVLFPEFAAVLEAFPGQRFNFNLAGKGEALALEFCNTLEYMKADDRALVSSFTGHALSMVRDRFPEIATCFTFLGVTGFYALFKAGLLYFKKKFKPDVLMISERIGVSYIANPGLIHEAQARGLRVYVTAVDSGEQARRLIQSGVDGLVTNNLAKIKSVKGNS